MSELTTASIPQREEGNKQASPAETREIVTPYAFHVSEVLLGTPLGTPLKRLMALLVDLVLVAIVSSASSVVLAFFAALTFLRAGSHLKNRPKRSIARKSLRVAGAVLLFVTIVGIVDFIQSDIVGPTQNGSNNAFQKQLLTGVGFLAFNQCENDINCIKDLARELSTELAETDIDRKEANELITRQIGDKGLTLAQQKDVITVYMNAFDLKRSAKPVPLPSPPGEVESSQPGVKESQSYSIIEWAKGIATDLGLGFGWAALYFSVFTAWWGGATPGKKLFGLRVVKLDNSPLTLWESFGRYGGYGAGIATGLLGFMQVYWDPNRQAIQDKISETFVIDIRRKSVVDQQTLKAE